MTFCSSVIEENKSNQVILFTAVDKMLNRLAPKKLPQDDNAADLANKFAEFFVHKNTETALTHQAFTLTMKSCLPSYK